MSNRRSHLLGLADQCVKCGYCLPHCPTFRLHRDESESPRGRIALIQGLLSGELTDGKRLGRHLDNCLECLACEPVCPSLVHYGELMDGARAVRAARGPVWRRALARRRLDLLSDPRWLRGMALLAIAYRRSGLSALLARSGLVRSPRLAVLDGVARRLRRPRPPAAPGAQGRCEPAARQAPDQGPNPEPVALFVGCVARGLQGATAEACLRVLRRLGHSVREPVDQECCGAMHRHNGWPESADRMLERNRSAFGDGSVLGFASACVAELRRGLDATEICRFLTEAPWPSGLSPRPLPGVAIVHEPCSHRNALRDSEAVYALLARIPALEVRAADGNEICCGAAGAYLLDHPATAVNLGDEKARGLQRQLRDGDTTARPRWLVTTNTGCAVHLAARLCALGLSVEVLHPVELLDRQLDRDAAGAIRNNGRS